MSDSDSEKSKLQEHSDVGDSESSGQQNTYEPSSSSDLSPASSGSQSGDSSPPSADEHTTLVDKARAFLASPQVRGQDVLAKHKFLEEKGLNGKDIDMLLQELVCVFYEYAVRR